MSRFVTVDLETTGNSAKNGDEIIEIGIVVIEDGKIVDEYESKVKPNGSIPPFVSQLTGIEMKDLRDAPTFKEIIPEILPYFEDRFFIAHPVHFDYEFLKQSLVNAGYPPIACPVIDTVELSRVFFPSAPGYRLQDLTAYLDIEHFKPHRALSDAYVTALLFIEIIHKIRKLPVQTLRQLSPLLSNLQTDIHYFFEEILEEKRYENEANADLTFEYGLAMAHPSEPIAQPDVKMDDFNQYLDQLFEESTFEKREGQKEIAKEIYSSFQLKQHHVIEAGPGLGKTLAYLLSSYAFSQQTGKRVIISTYTLQLQKQIYKYSDRFPSIFPKGSMALLKSPKNYIHIKRFKAFYDRYSNEIGNFDITLTLALILVWLTETKTGDIEELQLPSRGQDIWNQIACDHDDDTTDLASYFFRAKEKAKQAPIVIVNHAFLIMDLKKGRKGIPAGRQIIVDEAHHFENVTRHQLSQQIDYLSAVQLFQTLNKLDSSRLIEEVKMHADFFFRSIYQAVDFLHSDDDPVSDTGKIQLTVDDEALKMIFNGKIREELNQFLLSCEKLHKIVLNQSQKSELERSIQQKAARQLENINSFLKEFFHLDKQAIRWIEIDQLGAKNSASLHMEPIRISEQLKKWYEQYTDSLVFMSSTLQTKESFHHFMNQVGLSKETSSSIYLVPLAYVNRSQVLIPSDFPQVTDLSATSYANHVASFVMKLFNQTNKKILVLFTSYQMLRETYEKIKLHGKGMTVLAQGIQSSSRDKLKKQFEEMDDVILLGTSSFWEGMDLLDEPEKIICMARLPFESTNQPVYRAKWNMLKQENKNAFERLALPTAILRFRQAFGRLIRHSEDRGLFIVLDRRLMSKSYGKQFIQALSPTPVFYEESDELIEHARKWLSYEIDE